MTAIALKDYGDRPSWLASRGDAIGASEVAGLFTDAAGNSLSPYTTAHILWLERTGQLDPVELSAEHIAMGNLMEPVIAGLLAAGFQFYRWDGETGTTIRLVTAFNTTPLAVDSFIDAARRLAAGGAERRVAAG